MYNHRLLYCVTVLIALMLFGCASINKMEDLSSTVDSLDKKIDQINNEMDSLKNEIDCAISESKRANQRLDNKVNTYYKK